MHLLQSLVAPHAKCLVRMACRMALGHSSEFLDTAVVSIGIKAVVNALKEELQVAQVSQISVFHHHLLYYYLYEFLMSSIMASNMTSFLCVKNA